MQVAGRHEPDPGQLYDNSTETYSTDVDALALISPFADRGEVSVQGCC